MHKSFIPFGWLLFHVWDRLMCIVMVVLGVVLLRCRWNYYNVFKWLVFAVCTSIINSISQLLRNYNCWLAAECVTLPHHWSQVTTEQNRKNYSLIEFFIDEKKDKKNCFQKEVIMIWREECCFILINFFFWPLRCFIEQKPMITGSLEEWEIIAITVHFILY